MAEQAVRLIYPPSLINVPIINLLIRRFDLSVNILMAQISPEQGWLDIQLAGPPIVIEEAIQWLEKQGLTVVKQSK